jgi:hypothetical protein
MLISNTFSSLVSPKDIRISYDYDHNNIATDNDVAGGFQ